MELRLRGSRPATPGAVGIRERPSLANTRATRMACSPALDSQEVEFLSLLEAVHYFDVSDDGALFLHTANGAIIKARRE